MTMYWDSVAVIVVDFMSKRATINANFYIDTLKKLKARIRRVRPALEMSKVLLQHDNARPHTSLKTREVIAPLAGQQFHIFHTRHTWYRLNSICLEPSKKV